MTTIAVLPVKRLSDAKQRLGGRLSPGTRRLLAESMATDVLIALRRAIRVDATVVVTSEAAIAAIARGHGAETIADPPEPGHNPAARKGVAHAVARGASRVLLVPGDCPALVPAEVDGLLAPPVARNGEVVVVPDRHGTGTNALVLAPPHAIEPSFGPGSRERHERAARTAGVACRIAEPFSLALDVDTADDLDTLRAAFAQGVGGAAHTRGALMRLGERWALH